MKKISLIILIAIFIGCSDKPEPKLELSQPEAFSFDLGDSWEVNSAVTAIGFLQKEENDSFLVSLSYSLDLVTPIQDTLLSIYTNNINEADEEEFMDFILEAQLEIDTKFGEGDYSLIYNVLDNYSSQTKSIIVDFKLAK